MFTALQTPLVRIHNRPSYNSECHATRDMGIMELNNSYEDAELADCIMAIGCNPYETQTNYFLYHWLPNLHGATVDKKKKWFCKETKSREGTYHLHRSAQNHNDQHQRVSAARPCTAPGHPARHRRGACSTASSPM